MSHNASFQSTLRRSIGCDTVFSVPSDDLRPLSAFARTIKSASFRSQKRFPSNGCVPVCAQTRGARLAALRSDKRARVTDSHWQKRRRDRVFVFAGFPFLFLFFFFHLPLTTTAIVHALSLLLLSSCGIVLRPTVTGDGDGLDGAVTIIVGDVCATYMPTEFNVSGYGYRVFKNLFSPKT